MVENFQLGSAYRDVQYGQYVILNPNDRADNTYGKIFRRGYDYKNEAGGAEEIFAASGSSGYLPNISNLSNVSATGIISGNITPQAVSAANQHKIQVKHKVQRSENADNTTLKLDFIVPKPKFQFSTNLTDVNTYSYSNNVLSITSPNITPISKTESAFDHNYNITIPISSHGGNLKNISISEANNHFYLNYSKTTFNRFTEGNITLSTVENNTLQPKNLEYEDNDTILSINNWQGKCKIYKNNNNLYVYFIVTEQKPIPNTFTYNIINGTININFPYIQISTTSVATNTSQILINQQVSKTLTYNTTNIGDSAITITTDGQLVFNLLSNLPITLENNDIVIGNITIDNLTIMQGAAS